jgi:hypothetical protein
LKIESAGAAASVAGCMKLDLPAGDFAGYIFDLDGTLVDTMPLHYRAWAEAMRAAEAAVAASNHGVCTPAQHRAKAEKRKRNEVDWLSPTGNKKQLCPYTGIARACRLRGPCQARGD